METIWIVGTIVLMVIVVVIMVVLVMSGKGAAERTVSETDLIGCCGACCASPSSAQCKTAVGPKPLADVWRTLRNTNSPFTADRATCSNIPLCRCPE